MRYVVDALLAIGVGGLAAAVCFVSNWLALIPWRRNKDTHWSEQARLLYPAFAAARSNLWVGPALFTCAALLIWPESSALWALVATATTIGAYAGTLGVHHEVFPRIALRDLWRQLAITCLLRLAMWFVFIAAVVWMPQEINSTALGIVAAVLGLGVIWNRGGSIWVLRKLGLLVPAPARLRAVVTQTAARMDVRVRDVRLMRVGYANALAMPRRATVLFTQRLLDLLTDEELATVCAHELAHLTESRMARYARTMPDGTRIW
jgi:Zn-dependent protease with chaperone function